ncbi:xanthine dehydrogenase family protein [Pseudaminobacter sp. 19-2017]|uniref:Xanthine dehydrogenase family protein n=1 Tax=Pseudaminobacter soli (ex Zhang et al. 2022) TaxID=2831468 RepID=A0A942E1E3_9HYPH|nr:xanthine dehydrogenase family protein molybdopterin-binding subunit [Pseudaminobacter soli]MBS3651631.1 xanthine dehydrogenase family protein [Pseudaminobacter soli]
MNERANVGIGARLPRKEDDRLMRGRGLFVGDISMPGLQDVAFLRSPLAHGRIVSVDVPEDCAGRVFTSADMAGVKPIRAVSGLPGFKPSSQPPLATGTVRFAGELVAMCVDENRAQAEDLVSRVNVDIEALPVLADTGTAQAVDAVRVHEDWADNIYLETKIEKGDRAVLDNAAIKVEREIRLSRQCMAPLEGKGTVAWWDSRLDQLVVYTSTQLPHMMRTGLAECLGLEERQIHVVAPDVGGAFGFKCILQPEEVCIAWLAMTRRRPFRWLEDRREHLVAAANTREHHYRITGYADAEGRLLGIEADVAVDVGAYSVWPFSACLESAQIASILPGPYVMPYYACRTVSVATNKPPFTPYRGVARTGVCFAIELIVDAIAREAGREPSQVRLDNLVRPEQMPFTNITGKLFDSGDYPESVRKAVEAIDLPALRARQGSAGDDGRLLGIGFATYCEQAAHGTTVYSGWGIPMVPGFEQATARVTPDGGLELRIGVHSHGQGMETSMAQVANEILGIDPAQINLVHGDTALTPYSTGTWGSRSMVMAGGAVSRACEIIAERAKVIGAHLLQSSPDQVTVSDGKVMAAGGSVTFAEIANAWYKRPETLPADVAPEGLEVTAGYKPKVDSGTFSYATHAAVVAVDPEFGAVDILDYVVVEDGGTLVNPLIVDGQILGGVAQGIGTALYEESPYNADGQPLASTFMDYIIPGPCEVPDIRIVHMETPSPFTAHGVKGIGEGGAIAPPAAIANAINDALRPLGAEVATTPVTPHRLLSAIAEARAKAAGAVAQ